MLVSLGGGEEGKGRYLKEANTVAQQQHYPWGWNRPGTSLLMFMWVGAPDPTGFRNSSSAHVDAFKLGQQVEGREQRKGR